MEFRDVSFKDMQLIFKWANDPLVRQNSFNQNKIGLEEHKAWLKSKLADPNCLFLIGNVNNMPIGEVRIDVEDAKAVISFMIAEEHRGKGYGSQLIKGIVESCRTIYPNIKYFIGNVKKSNIASQKSFLKAGFSERVRDINLEYYLEV